MGRFTYLDHNTNEFAKATTVIGVSSVSAIYPAANLQTLPIANTYRSGNIATITIQIGLGAAAAFRLVALINHNLTSTALVTVRGGSVAVPDGSQFITTIPWRQRDMFKLIDPAQSWQFWSIVISDPANLSGFLEIGYLLGGNAVTLDFGFNYGWQVADIFENIGSSNYGVPNLQDGFEQVRVEMIWENMTATQSDVLRAFFRSVKGNLVPFFLIPDSDKAEGYFGRFTGAIEISRGQRHSSSTTFLEDSQGLSIPA